MQTLQRIRLKLSIESNKCANLKSTSDDDWYSHVWAAEIGEYLFGGNTNSPTEETEITEVTKTDETTAKNDSVKKQLKTH